MAELVFFRRGEEVLRIHLDRPRVVLGRSEGCDVVLPDPQVSRQHALVAQDSDGFRLEDLSGKGTLLRGQPRGTAPLLDGDDLTLGPWRALFRSRSSEPEALGPTVGTSSPTQSQHDVLAVEQPLGAVLHLRKGALRRELALHEGGQLLLGSAPGCDSVLDDRYASARHLRVTRAGNRFQLTDQHTTNGTWLGNTRLHQAEVGFYTPVRVGETELWFEPQGEPEQKQLSYHGIFGQAASVRRLAEQIEKVAPSTAAVTILGESGTGKELVARAIHLRSSRAERPLVPVNCAAISRELIESELFGHEKGAFTGALSARRGAFEEADGGTLFLDEVGELPLELQPKLLRALESGEIKRVGAARPSQVDVRIVAATNRDLRAEALAGRFREDLYYRLCVLPLHLAPLRSRRGDLPAIAEELVRRFAPRGPTLRLTPAALERLAAHSWPGNVRELRNVIHRALLFRRGPVIDAADLLFDAELSPTTGMELPASSCGLRLEEQLEGVERQIVESALRRCAGNREQVARELGIARSTLFKRLKEWGITG
jgi:two-component system response regulator HydG